MTEARGLRLLPLSCVAAGAIVSSFFFLNLPEAMDLEALYLPAAHAMLRGASPYEYQIDPQYMPHVAEFYNPLLPVLPLAFLPDHHARLAFLWISFAALAFVAARLRIKPWAIPFLFALWPSLIMLKTGQIEWMVVLALVLPARWGLLLAVVKPQAGLGLALYYAFEVLSGRESNPPRGARKERIECHDLLHPRPPLCSIYRRHPIPCALGAGGLDRLGRVAASGASATGAVAAAGVWFGAGSREKRAP